MAKKKEVKKKTVKKKGRQPKFDSQYVFDIAVEVYKLELNRENPPGKYTDDKRTAVEKMLAKDAEKNPNDNGKRLGERAQIYAPHVRAVLTVLEQRGELPEDAKIKE